MTGSLRRCITAATLAFALLLAIGGCAKPVVTADVCVYGGTSGGVIAAAAAARAGKTAVIIEPGAHLGGMSSGGLSWTDVGNADRVWVLGGMAREFYERVGKHYGQDPNALFESPPTTDETRTGYDFAKPPSLSFEPKVAEAVFNEMAREAKVTVRLRERLASVRKDGTRITELVTPGGSRVRAKVFIDATYEGDLMAMAGASFTYGREANAQYDETANGVQGPATNPRAGKFDVPVDPYVTPGQPASGVLPYLVQSGELGEIGAADHLIQSYNYRVCLTDK